MDTKTRKLLEVNYLTFGMVEHITDYSDNLHSFRSQFVSADKQTFLKLTLTYNKDIDFHCNQNHTLTLSSSFSFFTSPRSRICLRRKFITSII